MSKKQLPARDVRLLDIWLENGGDLAEFFSIGGDLGEPSEYDLSRWQSEGGKKPLPKMLRDMLDGGRLKFSDLKLLENTEHLPGELSEYNLSAWQE